VGECVCVWVCVYVCWERGKCIKSISGIRVSFCIHVEHLPSCDCRWPTSSVWKCGTRTLPLKHQERLCTLKWWAHTDWPRGTGGWNCVSV